MKKQLNNLNHVMVQVKIIVWPALKEELLKLDIIILKVRKYLLKYVMKTFFIQAFYPIKFKCLIIKILCRNSTLVFSCKQPKFHDFLREETWRFSFFGIRSMGKILNLNQPSLWRCKSQLINKNWLMFIMFCLLLYATSYKLAGAGAGDFFEDIS
ncbi:hypothetical protein SAMN06265377_1495 [Flagellimonas pacifica]|uniref:Transmembrane protein n=1 Tax=Flagellimonas pacifica TaxID=1247520 RepID=A0A285MR76_9FLAO|nr:hypothetical protein SAMN06265377_1495 [Allomuricauda parva]